MEGNLRFKIDWATWRGLFSEFYGTSMTSTYSLNLSILLNAKH